MSFKEFLNSNTVELSESKDVLDRLVMELGSKVKKVEKKVNGGTIHVKNHRIFVSGEVIVYKGDDEVLYLNPQEAKEDSGIERILDLV